MSITTQITAAHLLPRSMSTAQFYMDALCSGWHSSPCQVVSYVWYNSYWNNDARYQGADLHVKRGLPRALISTHNCSSQACSWQHLWNSLLFSRQAELFCFLAGAVNTNAFVSQLLYHQNRMMQVIMLTTACFAVLCVCLGRGCAEMGCRAACDRWPIQGTSINSISSSKAHAGFQKAGTHQSSREHLLCIHVSNMVAMVYICVIYESVAHYSYSCTGAAVKQQHSQCKGWKTAVTLASTSGQSICWPCIKAPWRIPVCCICVY